jgi:protein associated with RNAse G/E
MSLVNVVFRKYDGSLHWNYLATRLGEDEHGVWLGAPAGTALRRGEVVIELAEMDHVVLLPRDGWWTAAFNAPPKRTEIYCDISTVPAWTSAEEVTMIDLDLDVLRRRAGLVELVDEDEFAEHQVHFGYPPEVIDQARAAADWLVAAVTARQEPFGVAYEGWLRQVSAA